ncbi:MAG: amino acid ABC transporter substrate-binding protein [Sphingobacteriales bacterium]|nr:amino acid ABC transporter substrate-binding protein [Sphingobacteriales bacterium]
MNFILFLSNRGLKFIALCLFALALTSTTSACFKRSAPQGKKNNNQTTILQPLPPDKNATTTQTPTNNSTENNNTTTPTKQPESSNTNSQPTKQPNTQHTTTTAPPVNTTLPPETTQIKESKIPAIINMGIMLPFNLASYETSTEIKQLSDNSAVAVDFYQGALLALQDLEQSGLQLNLEVFDINNQAQKASELFNDYRPKNMHLIIGPVHNAPLAEIAKIALRNKTIHVSPLSPSHKVASNNPYYFVATPTVETQCAAMFEYICKANNTNNKRILAISSSSPNELALANLFHHIAINSTEPEKYGYVNVQQILYDKNLNTDIESFLSPTEPNMVVVTSFDEKTIIPVIMKLNALQKKYQITLFGMPTWLDMEIIPHEYLANLNFHISAPYWGNPANPNYQPFKQNYQLRWGYLPSKNAAIGYDITKYFVQMIQKYGTDMANHLGDNSFKGMLNDFEFSSSGPDFYLQPALQKPFDFWENKATNILRFRPDFTFERVNY